MSYAWQCPSTPHEIPGCGRWFRQQRDDEGFVDCPHCGLAFNPTAEATAEAVTA